MGSPNFTGIFVGFAVAATLFGATLGLVISAIAMFIF